MRAHFERLRAADAATAPAFRDVLARAESRPVRADRTAFSFAARAALSVAVAAALVLAASIARESQRRRAFDPQPLSIWVSPTASLLNTPGTALLSSSALPSSSLGGNSR